MTKFIHKFPDKTAGSDIYASEMDPISIKRRMIAVLQHFFRGDPDYPYDDDQETSRIIIADVYGIDRRHVEKFPLITVGRGNMGFQKTGIGSLSHTNWTVKSGNQPSSSYAGLVAGSLVCHCISTAGLEAEMIAMKIANFFEMTRHDLRKAISVLDIKNVQMHEEQPQKEWPTQVDVPVSFEYIYPTTWKVTDYNTVIKQINQSVQQK